MLPDEEREVVAECVALTVRDAEGEMDTREDADAQKLALGVKVEVTVLDTVDDWLPEKDALGLREGDVLGDNVPHEEGLPLDEAYSDMLALGERVPDTEVQPEGVADTEPVEEREGLPEGLSVPLMVPLTVPDTDKVPIWVTVAVSEVVMQELTLAETNAEADTLVQAVPLEEKDIDAVFDTEAVWQLVEDTLLLADRELLGVNEELTLTLPVDDCDGECVTVTLEVALTVGDKGAEKDAVKEWHPDEEPLALAEYDPACECVELAQELIVREDEGVDDDEGEPDPLIERMEDTVNDTEDVWQPEIDTVLLPECEKLGDEEELIQELPEAEGKDENDDVKLVLELDVINGLALPE